MRGLFFQLQLNGWFHVTLNWQTETVIYIKTCLFVKVKLCRSAGVIAVYIANSKSNELGSAKRQK